MLWNCAPNRHCKIHLYHFKNKQTKNGEKSLRLIDEVWGMWKNNRIFNKIVSWCMEWILLKNWVKSWITISTLNFLLHFLFCDAQTNICSIQNQTESWQSKSCKSLKEETKKNTHTLKHVMVGHRRFIKNSDINISSSTIERM